MGRRIATLIRPSQKTRANKSSLDIEYRLAEVLRELVPVLIANGYGIPRLSDVLRRLYIEAAKSVAEKNGKKLSNARIAALTGLTRTEVTRLSRQHAQKSKSEIPFNRAQKVAYGWISDLEFSNRGQPRILPFTGRAGSFSKLVRKYSGDIPARAMLSEIQRLGMVQVRAD